MCSPEPYTQTMEQVKPALKLRSSKLKLNTGGEIPILGFGTFQLKNEVGTAAVKSALSTGYRLIDAAYIYGNEESVGKGIKESIDAGVVKREDLFISSKVFNSFHSKERVKKCFAEDLRRLGLDYLDLYLIHWPQGYKEVEGQDWPKGKDGKTQFSDVDYLETWEAMEELAKSGKTKAIGLSNFSIKQIRRVLEKAKIKPAVLQVECHPYLSQEPLLKFCQEHSIVMMGYSPLGSRGSPDAKDTDAPVLLKDPMLEKIGERHKKTAGQVALRWNIQRGVVPIPRSKNPKHIEENANVFDFELTLEEINEISKLNKNYRYIAMKDDRDHQHHPWFGPDRD